MGRLFNGTTQRLSKTTPPVSTYPVSIAVWTNINALPSVYGIFCDIADANDVNSIQLYMDSLGYVYAFDAGNMAQSPITLPLNSWCHLGAVLVSPSNRTIYINGGNSANNTTASGGMAPQQTSWGNQYQLSYNVPGIIAFGAIWSAALTATDFLALSKGISPKRYKPNNLVCYFTDSQGASPVPDLANPIPWTVWNAPPNAVNNPRIYGP